MDLSPTYLWLIAAVALILAESIGASGFGLLFVGLGALLTSALLNAGIIAPDAQLMQLIVCCAGAAVTAIFLWKPLQRYRQRHSSGYSNILGETAYVGSQGLKKGVKGEATWSGTIMQAEIAHDSNAERLEPGTPVTIVEVTGNKLVVKPKG